jgi:heme-degrading monooxygenase HmoA
MSRPPKVFRFLPNPFPPSVLGAAPCVEVATFFKTEERFLGNVEKFMECLSEAEGYLGHALGEVVEEIEKEEDAGKGKAVLLCIGWDSKDTHMKFRETNAFKKNIDYLREGLGGVAMVSLAAFTILTISC